MRSTGCLLLALLGIVPSAVGTVENEDNSILANLYDDIEFYLFTRNNKSGEKIQHDIASFLRAGWNPQVPTRVVVHGFMNSISSPMVTTLITAFLEEGDYNVIAVDWSKYVGFLEYPLSRLRVKGVGTFLANLLDLLIEQRILKRESLHLIGHSLGAHVVGNAGKAMAETGGKISRITGLDPALPGFSETSDDRLSEDDAEVVDVIHTNGGWMGFETPVGQVDFFPNGGKKQPGCGLDVGGVCSHGRSFELFAESILNKNAFRYATLIESSQNSTSSSASKDDEVAQMGYWLHFSQRGSYYLQTASTSPFDLGSQPILQSESFVRRLG